MLKHRHKIKSPLDSTMELPQRRSPLTLFSCLSAYIAVGLLISPAMAQVNGPGPSPSASFDTVLNLPGDEAIITGGILESIGGIPGETTQLNVGNGGAVGVLFDALSGSEVNVNSGGNLGNDFNALPGSEVNIISGSVGNSFDAFPESVVNISGGAVGSSFNAFSGSCLLYTSPSPRDGLLSRMPSSA